MDDYKYHSPEKATASWLDPEERRYLIWASDNKIVERYTTNNYAVARGLYLKFIINSDQYRNIALVKRRKGYNIREKYYYLKQWSAGGYELQ